MDLNNAIKQFEAVEANLAKLDRQWSKIKSLLPSGRDVGVSDHEEYLQLLRSFEYLAKQMPTIDGVALEICLMHPDDIVRAKVDCLEIDEFTTSVALDSEIFRQGDMLNDYRFRLESKRRELARQAVQLLCEQIDLALLELEPAANKRAKDDAMPQGKWETLTSLFKSIDALLGNSLDRPSRWNDMSRHLGFGLRTYPGRPLERWRKL